MDIQELNEKVIKESAAIDLLMMEMGKKIIGQKNLIEKLLIALFCNGHILLEGVPGLAKTLSISTLAAASDVQFQRIQFTPDLLPADLTGTMIYNQRTSDFAVKKGPVFSNFILADEINRSPAKVQSALLEAMQELQVTIGEETFKLEEPFLVLATQNPIEQEGTYPLPEAQVDRFMLKVKIEYPKQDEELGIIRQYAVKDNTQVKSVINKEKILEIRRLLDTIYVGEKIEKYVLDIVFATREPDKYGLGEIKDLIKYGASPRASINLIRAAKAYAFLRKRGYIIPEDIRAIGYDVLRHRILLTYEAEAEEVSPEDIITKIFDTVEIP